MTLHRHHIAILLFTLAVHGLLLLNDGVYYDGWLAHTFVEFGNTDRLHRWFFDSGVPQVYYLHLWLGAMPGGVFAYKLLAFLCIAGSGLLVYTIGHESGFMGRLESLLVALLSGCYPAFQAAPEITILPFLICYTLFLLGVLLALRAQTCGGRRHFLLTVAALLCFLAGFTIPSLLVFYGGFLWLLAASILERQGAKERGLRRVASGLRELTGRRLPYLLLPVAFWAAKKLLLPPGGYYSEYNQFNFTLFSLKYNFRTFLASSLYDQFTSVLALPGHPLWWLLLLLVAGGVSWALRLPRRRFVGGSTRPATRLWFGSVCLMLGILPYVLVGKAPDMAGFGTRHSLLIGLPVAIILVAIVQLLLPGSRNGIDDQYAGNRGRVGGGAEDVEDGPHNAGGRTTTANSLSHAGWILLTVLILLFSASMVNSYLGWQARWIKSRAVMQALAHNPASGAYSTYWVRDRFNTGPQDAWVFQEWSSLFKTVWKDETRAGMDLANPDLWRVLTQRPQYLTAPANSHFNLSTWNPRGRQADLTIDRGPAATSDAHLAARYFLHRFLRPGDLPGYLAQVATVRVTPASKPKPLPSLLDTPANKGSRANG